MAGRASFWFAIVFTVLAIASMLLVLLPGLVKSMPVDLWLVTADITGLNTKVLPTLHLDPSVSSALAWADYVSIGLWNACARHDRKDTHVSMCTEASISYNFNPASVWSYNNGHTKVDLTLPQNVHSSISVHGTNTVLIKLLFIVGMGLSVIGLVLGGIGACVGSRNHRPAFRRRILACVVLLNVISTVLLLIGAGVATQSYITLLSVVNPAFGSYIIFSLGHAGMAMLWVSEVLSLLAAVFWIFAWRKERTYKQLCRTSGKFAWSKNGVEIHVDQVPSEEGSDDRTLLEEDTMYRSQCAEI